VQIGARNVAFRLVLFTIPWIVLDGLNKFQFTLLLLETMNLKLYPIHPLLYIPLYTPGPVDP
jgi:hypothetical protein